VAHLKQVKAQAAVISERHARTENPLIKILIGKNYIITALTREGDGTVIPFPIEITCTGKGLLPTNLNFEDSDIQKVGENREIIRNIFIITDFDGDGILNAAEDSSDCLDAADADTDDDGIADGDEDINKDGVQISGETNPCLLDLDCDNQNN
jgi:hypothetical protein